MLSGDFRASMRLAHDDPAPVYVRDAIRTLALAARERDDSPLGALAVEFADSSEVSAQPASVAYSLPRVSVLIPVRGAHDCLRAAFRCLSLDTTERDVEVVVACAEDERDGVLAAWDSCVWPGTVSGKIVTTPEPQGYAANVNLARSVARGAHLAILNSDAYVPPGWLDALMDEAVRVPCVAVGPAAQVIVHGLAPTDDDLPAVARRASACAREAFGADGGRGGVERLVGFCVVVSAWAFDAVGGMHEGYGIGNFDDDDLCLRLRCLGELRTVPFGVAHQVSASFRALPGGQRLYEDSMIRNRALFFERWGWWLDSERLPCRGTVAMETAR